jgi:tetratricopeptide (TPR) repeat protein
MPGARNAWAQFEAFRDVAESRVGRRLTSTEVNRYWIDFTWSQIDDDLSGWLALLLEKARLFWNDAELPNTHHYRFHRRLNPLLGLPLVQFGWIVPFALLGLPLLFLRREREGVFLALYVLVGMAALVLFFVLAHYRLPLVPALLLTAVASVVQLGRWLSAHRFVAVLLASLLLSGGSFLTFMPTGFAERLDDEYFKLGYAYHVEGDLDAAQQAYRQALAENPENLSARGRLAQLYEQRGDLRAAVVEWVHVGRIANRLGALRYEREARDQLRRLGVVPQP